ncbi:epoxyqueuosine reductase [Desulforhabdus amnigena]|jgi:epoxyqueuosine reductase QueG|uniref:(Fe-S)-binding protein n=1 Tax=Desulforhabdus amnigena TaxID=40218 RepID=A0A9W6FWB8_9BACT|nr:epoxyqueuosine reductase [Desulforhabdus amnigena]NLJ29114.1 epoxyqueuosine reductase [Deltaproteobacteria bacterium]GLI36037.1 (Fe-S)-binding protein [Desulforhabdus amnigena]
MSISHDPLASEAVSWLQKEIQSTIKCRLDQKGEKNYWREALVGIANADDPLFLKLREVVGPEHSIPQDLLPEARSVIVFFLPFQKTLGRENDQSTPFAARSWAESYVTTNRLIQDISMYLKSFLEKEGHETVITPATHNFDTEKLISGWSHKHIGYIAGLGTFGYHNLLITSSGCCGRLGSLVTSMSLPSTKRPDREWCLVKAGRNCFACVAKCKYDALHKTHYDRHACYEQCLRNDAHYDDLPLVDVCGKCACEVPCSYQIPTRLS